jgi:transposase
VNNLHEKHLPHEPVKANGRNVVGIDIGRKNHVAAGVRASGDLAGPKITFTNDRPGIDRLEKILLAPLGGPANVLVAMEATGHYWMPVCFELTRRGYECAVINPIQTRAKFRTRIRKSKTDKIDSESIARLALGGEAHTARIPEEPVFELRMLARHRWRLVGQIGDLKRFALTLVDRVFPEFATSLSNPLGPSSASFAYGAAVGALGGVDDARRADGMRRCRRVSPRSARGSCAGVRAVDGRASSRQGSPRARSGGRARVLRAPAGRVRRAPPSARR